MRLAKLLANGVLLVAVFCSNPANAETLTADSLSAESDGWHTWQVDEPGASTEMCCYTWKRGSKSSGAGCDLDGNNISFSDGADCGAVAGTMQIYVRLDAGIPEDIRVLSSNCPVSTETAVTDHGLQSVTDNIDWFRAIIEDQKLDHDVREEALFALVLSGSDAAYVYLDNLLTQR
jgi:hypothetical protein